MSRPVWEQIHEQFQSDAATVGDAEALEQLRIRYLGRKGLLAEAMEKLKDASKEEKPAMGRGLNRVKGEIAKAVKSMQDELGQAAPAKTCAPQFDVTLPGRRPSVGAVHLLNRACDEVVQVFRRMGFEVVAGPEIEDEFHNFSALNVPETHPAREMSDNFYFENGALLRSQTSTVQIRHMEKVKPPVRMVAPGRVYRPETIDASHACMFHQVEGLAVDEGITFADLKHVLAQFAKEFFGANVKTRFRPHFFPFTEPSAEMDVSCSLCMGDGCPGCQHKGWIEVLGCGMVDPNVFEAVGYDPEKYTGFAFGMGVERMTMQRYGVPDIRAFIENDVRFLAQF